MSTIKRNLQLLWRSEKILAEARLKLTSRKLTLAVAAGIAGLFAIGMFNLAALFALMPSVGVAGAAALVGFINVLVAGLFLAIAQGLRPAEEEDMVREVRDMAIGELGGEIEEVQAAFAGLRSDVEGLRNNIRGLVRNPAEALSPAMILSTLSAISRLVKSGKK